MTINIGARCYAAFGFTWQDPEASLVWTEIPLRTAERAHCQRGRKAVTERYVAGEIDVSANNTDRTYDKRNTAGDYFGKLLPGTPLKLTLAAGPGTDEYTDNYYDDYEGEYEAIIARGYVQAWPQSSNAENTIGTVALKAFGIFDRTASASLNGSSALEIESLVDVPVAYWKLDDNTEDVMADATGNGHVGSYDNPTLGAVSLVLDDGHSVFFDHTADSRGKYTGPVVTGYPFTIEASIQVERDLTQSKMIVTLLKDSAATAGLSLKIQNNNVGENPNGAVTARMIVDLQQKEIQGNTTVDDDNIHRIAWRATNSSTWDLFVDGIHQTVTEPWTQSPSFPPFVRWALGNFIDVTSGDFGLGGLLDDVVIYDKALSALRIRAHAHAASAPWDGDQTGERILRIGQLLGLPADRMSVQVGRSRLGPAKDVTSHVLDIWQDIEASEDGRLFETADGRAKFLDRYYDYTADEAINVQVAFSDVPADIAAGTHFPYVAPEMPDGDDLLINVAVGSRADGDQITRRDDESVRIYGEHDGEFLDLLLPDDQQVGYLLDHKIATRSQPLDLIPEIRIPLHRMNFTQLLALLALDIGHRCSVKRTPQGVGDPWTVEGIVEWIEFDLGQTDPWMIIDLAPAVDPGDGFFIWGQSEWGDSTRWGW